MPGNRARPVRVAVGNGPSPGTPRRRPTALGKWPGETHRWQHQYRAPGRLNRAHLSTSESLYDTAPPSGWATAHELAAQERIGKLLSISRFANSAARHKSNGRARPPWPCTTRSRRAGLCRPSPAGGTAALRWVEECECSSVPPGPGREHLGYLPGQVLQALHARCKPERIYPGLRVVRRGVRSGAGRSCCRGRRRHQRRDRRLQNGGSSLDAWQSLHPRRAVSVGASGQGRGGGAIP